MSSCITHAAAVALGLGLLGAKAHALTPDIYRCSGTPVVYTSDPRLARDGRCVRVGASPVVAPRPGAVSPSSRPPALQPQVPNPILTVSRDLQRQRDADRVQILQAERARERERLAQFTQQLSALRSRHADAAVDETQVAELAEAIRRSESDLSALDKELSRALR